MIEKRVKKSTNIFLQYSEKILIKFYEEYFKFMISITDDNLIFIRLTYEKEVSYENLFSSKNKNIKEIYKQISQKAKNNEYRYSLNHDNSIIYLRCNEDSTTSSELINFKLKQADITEINDIINENTKIIII